MSEWQPIETAPKDGTPVIVYAESSVGEAYYDHVWKSWWWQNTERGDLGVDPLTPTHWMQLPDPPEQLR